MTKKVEHTETQINLQFSGKCGKCGKMRQKFVIVAVSKNFLEKSFKLKF